MADVERPGAAERLLRRQGWVVTAALIAITSLAALYTVLGIGMSMTSIEMTAMARPVGQPMLMGAGPVWTPTYALLVFLMWAVMMVAMMTPSAAPAVLLFGALKRQGPARDQANTATLCFLSGYLAIWGVFSIVATILQWGLSHYGLMANAMMTLASPQLAAALIAAAGLYQLTPAKTACLRHCQSPAKFLTTHQKPGLWGAFRMGVLHGAYCTGCCWALMALLFVGGIMNLYWIVGLAVYVAVEKLAPRHWPVSQVTGLGLIVLALWLIN
ncbi:DUF2182 domain-containing protein [Shimia abyssi]|uniref:Putative metal-binding membrane protein n=1 Tax=Shimia abyssi TaxID=1662395 RepID=A0A2P8FJW5_9RHOB|nr:DUF2182 domain-containing protein [Shimia abyssi]PSL22016.1 putative metal-binding membrane protein [Shimia abyssi]